MEQSKMTSEWTLHTKNGRTIVCGDQKIVTVAAQPHKTYAWKIAKELSANRELIEACEMLIQWDDFGGDAPEMLMDAVRAARAARKKARGE